jgi:tetratricopeptide (TPR) repeat protein
VEECLAPEHPVLRSGPATITRTLDHALSKLAIAYNDGSLTKHKTQWLIGGYLATGQIENARVYITDARERFPDDPDFKILDGVLAYSDGDLDRAAGLFEAALEKDADNVAVVFDLAVVESERGNAEKARELFERVRRIAPGSPMAIRAEAKTSEFD